MSPEEGVEAALVRARAARADGDLERAVEALSAAVPLAATLGPDHALAQRLAWRRSKLAHDRSEAGAALDALVPILEADPFAHYPAGLDALPRLAEKQWHALGYGSEVLRTLLERAHASHLAVGDRFRALQARVLHAWDLACAGDLDELAEVLEDFSRLHPDDLDGGPTRHARAADAATSVPWLQQDLARTCLRAGTWSRRPDLVEAAEDVLETSADDAGFERETEYWFLEPIALARQRLGRPDPDDYMGAWLALAPRLKHPRAGYHRALARASAEPDRGPSLLAHAAREAQHGDYGPEWEIDPLVEIGRLSGDEPPAARERIESHGVRVFAAASSL